MKITNTVTISSRPAYMPKISAPRLTGCRSAKFAIGPTVARPGPMFPMHAIDAVKAVTKSAPSAASNVVVTANNPT